MDGWALSPLLYLEDPEKMGKFELFIQNDEDSGWIKDMGGECATSSSSPLPWTLGKELEGSSERDRIRERKFQRERESQREKSVAEVKIQCRGPEGDVFSSLGSRRRRNN